MADLRCRWCGDYLLLPRFGGNGEPYCSDACCVESLERTLDFPSISPAEQGANRSNAGSIEATMVSARGAASTAPRRAHQPSIREDQMR